MKPLSVTLAWLQILAPLAIEVGFVAILAICLGRWSRSAVWRRTFCQAGTTALIVLAVSELAGSPRVTIARSVAALTRWRVPVPGHNSSASLPKAGLQLAPGSDAHLQRNPPAPSKQTPPQLDASFRSEAPADLASPPVPGTETEAQSISTSRGSSARPVPLIQAVSPALGSSPQRPTPASSTRSESSPLAWLWLFWGAGAAAVVGRILLARLFLMIVRLGIATRDAELMARVQSLSQALGLRRKVRLIESARLASPIAFGVIHPTIGWPRNFSSQFNTARQEAMVAHELAHLAAHDPFWCFLADAASALLWWHPAVWWLRRQLHVASEMAADEASLLVAGGPSALAQCLVELGVRLVRPALPGQLGIASFRSHLGRRVEQLVNLEGRSWSPPRRLPVALTSTFGPMAMAAIAVVCTAGVAPQAFKKGDSMKSMELNWKKSLSTIALLAVVNGPQAAAPAAEAGGLAPRPTEAATPPAQNSGAADRKPPAAADASPAQPASAAPAKTTDPLMKAPANPTPYAGVPSDPFRDRSALETRLGTASTATLFPHTGGAKRGARIESKLKEIVLAEVHFEALPLSEVIKFLSDECRKRDPDKEGINFLLDPNQPPGPAPMTSGIDPTTGLPVTTPQEAVDISSIIVKFSLPLRNVTMKDALDAVVRVADRPIGYSLEDYAVVFSLKPQTFPGQLDPGLAAPFPASMVVRTFRVDTNTFIPGLETAFGIKVESATSAGGPARSQKVQSALKELLTQLGISVTANKSVFFNDLTGIIMVKGTPEDLEIVGAAMETLGGVQVGSYGGGGGWPAAGN